MARGRPGAGGGQGATYGVDVMPNGLPVHRIGLPGTEALTLVVAFAAGSRTERNDEQGMAHFLEHLVFKGGERHPDPAAITDTAERLGASLNAYTSHHLVAFHATARGTAADPVADLLTDVVARPRLDPDDIAAERGVVAQEIARSHDDPATAADRLIDRAAFGDHPLGRPVLGAPETVASFTREDILAFRDRQWAGATGGAFAVGDLRHLPGPDRLAELFGRFPAVAAPTAPDVFPAAAPRVEVRPRASEQSHLRLLYWVATDVTVPRRRAALSVLATLLGGSMGSRLFREIRGRLGLAYLVYAFDHVYADGAVLQIGAGVRSERCTEALRGIRVQVDDLRAAGPTVDEVERARAYAAGQFVVALETSGTVARHAAKQAVVFGEPVDHRASIAALDAVTHADVVEAARAVAEAPAVAVVGPHDPAEFT